MRNPVLILFLALAAIAGTVIFIEVAGVFALIGNVVIGTLVVLCIALLGVERRNPA